jgi:hypothetical protein
MPIEPVREVLPDGNEVRELRRVLEALSGAIRETACFGTHVMKWCAQAATGGDEEIPLLLSLRRALEILDCISALVKMSMIDPCNVLLRSLLEVLLNTLYILQTDTKRRAMSFMNCYFHDRLRTNRKLDPTTKEGMQFKSQIRKDRLVGKMSVAKVPGLRKMIANAQAALRRPEYVETEAEYQRVRFEAKRAPMWYSLFGGPPNVEQLAQRLDLPGVYGILYRGWSSTVHGTDIIDRKISKGGTGGLEISQIRLPTDAQLVAQLALSLSLEFYRALVAHYVPGRQQELREWYMRELRPFYTGLIEKMVIRVA